MTCRVKYSIIGTLEFEMYVDIDPNCSEDDATDACLDAMEKALTRNNPYGYPIEIGKTGKLCVIDPRNGIHDATFTPDAMQPPAVEDIVGRVCDD